jgi:hypothetical protein
MDVGVQEAVGEELEVKFFLIMVDGCEEETEVIAGFKEEVGVIAPCGDVIEGGVGDWSNWSSHGR